MDEHHEAASLIGTEAALPRCPEQLLGLTAVFRPDASCVAVSDGFARCAGVDRASLIGRSAADIWRGPAGDERLRLIRDVTITGVRQGWYECFAGRRCITSLWVTDGPTPAANEVLMIITPTRGLFGGLLPGPALRTLRTPAFGCWDCLSDMELSVLRLLAMELTNAEMAARMYRSRRAVEWHSRNLLKKCGLKSRTSLFRAGYDAGLHEFNDADWEAILASRRLQRRKRHSGRVTDGMVDRLPAA